MKVTGNPHYYPVTSLQCIVAGRMKSGIMKRTIFEEAPLQGPSKSVKFEHSEDYANEEYVGKEKMKVTDMDAVMWDTYPQVSTLLPNPSQRRKFVSPVNPKILRQIKREATKTLWRRWLKAEGFNKEELAAIRAYTFKTRNKSTKKSSKKKSKRRSRSTKSGRRARRKTLRKKVRKYRKRRGTRRKRRTYRRRRYYGYY